MFGHLQFNDAILTRWQIVNQQPVKIFLRCLSKYQNFETLRFQFSKLQKSEAHLPIKIFKRRYLLERNFYLDDLEINGNQ